MPAHIAFVTWRDLPGLAPDDAALAATLRARGHHVHPAAWDDDGVPWNTFDAVVLRSCWDYHLRADAFDAWLARLHDGGARLWNPAPIVRWNAHKGYLVELADGGLPVVPTVLLRRGDDRDLGNLLRERGWPAAVLKPAIAASAWGARRITPGTAAGDDIDRWRTGHDLLVQPFLEAVAREGEWSLVYVDGAYSHAVRKRPGDGDFRVQHELGGSIEAGTPPALAREAAARMLDAIAGPWLYARVDGVVTDRGFLLMELELIEPSLFLDADPAATDRFADAIARVARG